MIHAKMLAALLQLLVVVLTAAEDDCPGVGPLPFFTVSIQVQEGAHGRRQPAIITGGLKRWPGAWRTSLQLALLGSKAPRATRWASLPGHSSLRKGGAIHTVPLEAVVHNDTLDLAYGLNHELYIFSNILKDLNDVDALGDLTRSKTTRHLPYHQHGQDWVVGIGVEGGGAGFHSHGDAWLALLPMATPDQDAAKVWYWYRHDKHLPAEVFRQLHRLDLSDSDITAARHDVESASTAVTRCVQRPGDILYLPRSFPHSTRNVGEGILVSIGAQFGRTNDGGHLGSLTMTAPALQMDRHGANVQEEELLSARSRSNGWQARPSSGGDDPPVLLSSQQGRHRSAALIEVAPTHPGSAAIRAPGGWLRVALSHARAWRPCGRSAAGDRRHAARRPRRQRWRAPLASKCPHLRCRRPHCQGRAHTGASGLA